MINIHKRIIDQPKSKVSELLKTLSTAHDQVWPSKYWPAMRFKDGFKVGSRGGHGLIRYTIIKNTPDEHCVFKFTKPRGFDGTHEFKLKRLSDQQSEISHKITMTTSFRASLSWMCFVRWLHDALIEDALDNIENHFSEDHKKTSYSFWVICLRTFYNLKWIKS